MISNLSASPITITCLPRVAYTTTLESYAVTVGREFSGQTLAVSSKAADLHVYERHERILSVAGF
jgi:hypothetical protein